MKLAGDWFIALCLALITHCALAQSAGTAPSRVAQQQSTAPAKTPDVIFVPTQQVVVERMLKLAEVGPKDIVYDLGCGDGRIVVTAVSKFGAKKAVGIDIDPQRIAESNANAKAAGVTDRVQFKQADLFESDFSEATVVTLYLLSTLNEKLRPILLKQLKPGTRIVSHDFAMGDWKPEQTIQVEAPDRVHTVHLWRVPPPGSQAAKRE